MKFRTAFTTFCVLLFAAQSALATIFTVTTLDDELDPIFNSADLSLREALVEAGNTAGSDTINFDQSLSGTITLSIVGDSTMGASAFGIADTVIVNGNNGNAGIVLDAGGTMRHFFVAGTGNLTLNSITLRNGLARGGNGGAGNSRTASGGGGAGLGGAVYNRGTLQINASTLAANLAQGGSGGGIGGSTCCATSTGGGGGGGVQGNGGDGASGNGVGSGGGGGGTDGNGISGVLLGAGGAGGTGGTGGSAGGSALFGAGGLATGAGGGGGAAGSGGNGGLGGIGGNGGVGGGGGGGGGGDIGGTSGTGGYGGGGGGAGSIRGAAGGAGGFGGGGGGAGNQTSSLGGLGGFAGGNGGAAGSNGSGSGGGGGLGGALFNEAGSITVENSTFSSNSAIGGVGRSNGQSGLGLGAALFSQGGLITLTQSTVAAHPAGVAIYLQDGTGASLTTNRSIFASSTDGHCGGDPLTVVAENLADDGSCAGVAIGLTGVAVVAAANGGPTFTHALLVGSEALNAAPSSTSNDQRGFAVDGVRDIGAFEAQIPVLTIPSDIGPLEADGPTTTVTLGTATATDVDSDNIALSISNDAPPAFSVGTHTVTWMVTDNHGHQSTKQQTVIIEDTTAPLLSLKGANPTTLTVGSNYTDAGAMATDNVDDDTDLSSNITVTNPVNTAMAGTYIITYDVSDSTGNPAIQITRTVHVLATVGGSISGLASGNTVEIQNNSGDNLVLDTDGAFTFGMSLPLNDFYLVSVLNNPTTPEQSCDVSAETGQITSGNITSVLINCVTNTYTIGGMVSGLAEGNTVVLQNKGGDDLVVSTDGSFTFMTSLTDESTYEVSVLTDPTTPNQTCTASNQSGALTGENITTVVVDCVTNTYTIGGMVLGLAEGNTVVLQNKGGDDLLVSTDGSFTFMTPLDDESTYEVSVLADPTSPNQTCTVSNQSGALAGENITTVVVDCVTNTYTIGGMVSGLAVGNTVVLQNKDGDDLVVSTDGSFTFITPLDDESTYEVSVLTDPTTPSQVCTVTNDSGTLAGANITDVLVSCTTNQYLIGGMLSNLVNGSSLSLDLNSGEQQLQLNNNGAFVFDNPLADLSLYDISVATQPVNPSQTCIVSNGIGQINAADITDVGVDCSVDSFFVGGNITGLGNGFSLILKNNNSDNLSINTSGSFVFSTPLLDLSSYEVSMQILPENTARDCILINDTGSIAGDDIDNVTITCNFVHDLIFKNGFE